MSNEIYELRLQAAERLARAMYRARLTDAENDWNSVEAARHEYGVLVETQHFYVMASSLLEDLLTLLECARNQR